MELMSLRWSLGLQSRSTEAYWALRVVGRKATALSSSTRPLFPSTLSTRRRRACSCVRADMGTLDLTEENVRRVLLDARTELLQVFDTSVGITGIAELADLDGPFLKLRLKGRFWHRKSIVLARLANYLQKRIPDIVDVGIEDEAQLDDSAANFDL